MEDKDLKYNHCSNCGKYFTSEQENEDRFCSDECKIYYRSCKACGNYFISSRVENTFYCSNDCGITPEQEAPAQVSQEIAQASQEFVQEQPLSLLQPPRTLSVDSL